MAHADGHYGDRFDELLALATEAANGLDLLVCFRTCFQLTSLLKLRRQALHLPAANRSAGPEAMSDPDWETQRDARQWVEQVLRLAECIIRLGAADIPPGSGISPRDYPRLLRSFLEAHGAVMRRDFIDMRSVGERLAHEVAAVRALLETRCEMNGLKFGRLVGEMREGSQLDHCSRLQLQEQQQRQQQEPLAAVAAGGCGGGGWNERGAAESTGPEQHNRLNDAVQTMKLVADFGEQVMRLGALAVAIMSAVRAVRDAR